MELSEKLKSQFACNHRKKAIQPGRDSRELHSARSLGRRRHRRGATTVEFAIVAPLLIMIVFGIIEFGRMIMVQQVLTNAAREGARRAIIEDATDSEVKQLVSDYLSNASVSGAAVTVAPTDLSDVGFGDPVTVTVEVPFEKVSWAGPAWFLGGATLQSSTVMQGERLQ